ncbi:L-lactate dehydrogenase [Liquorilactobacillus nagelii]|uniref:L-lactate dehydrogenase n=1 Tax=Liquorilactobacillus nagelii TaxID=82688 RepID=UPI0006EFB7BD|nr:L-lactate dehydrogenase [Liquorilactobacillus nagelii]KRL41065.1 L-2-hydroxyisocaproate dehydrogenase [Liquorilactobacillus nagelii DSM 13675]QYH54004.1 L-lactate dehydrogenase [Liquorilactobacillus nagelii DSM 13675]
MTRKIAVIGLGHVGTAISNYLIFSGATDELVLIDKNELKLNAEATDFADAAANLTSHTKIIVNDYAALADADVIVSALGNISQQNDDAKHDRFVELAFNQAAAKEVGTKIKESGFNGVLVSISNPCDVIAALFQKFSGLPEDQVIGTGTLLDSARMKKAVGQTLKVDPRSVSGYNLGEHGNSQFTAWSTVRVLDQPITKLAEEDEDIDLAALNETVRAGGYTVFHGKHYTNYGIASAAVHLVNAILSDSHEELPVSYFHEKYGTYISSPVVISKKGIAKKVPLDLTPEEQAKLQKSAEYVKNRFDTAYAELK